MRKVLVAVTAVLLVAATAARAQSLADVAKREEERRKSVRTPGKVYTNDTLRSEPPPSAPAPAAPVTPEAPAATPPAGAQPPQAGQAPAGQAPDAAAAPKTEVEWRQKVTAAREALSPAPSFAEALQSRTNALPTDFVTRDDPAQREVVAAERQKALAEFDRVRKEIQQYQKEISGIQDEARRAGAPAGWVR